MGYYTRYTLEWDEQELLAKTQNTIDNLEHSLSVTGDTILPSVVRTAVESEITRLKALLRHPNVQKSLVEIVGYDPTDGQTKWYEWENDMKALSVKFPDILLTLTGYGEEDGDIWRAYFKNGRGYRVEAKVAFDSFDEAKLTGGNA